MVPAGGPFSGICSSVITICSRCHLLGPGRTPAAQLQSGKPAFSRPCVVFRFPPSTPPPVWLVSSLASHTHSHASFLSQIMTAFFLSTSRAVLAVHWYFIPDIIYSRYYFPRIPYSAISLSASFPFEPNTHMFKIYFSHVLFFFPSSAVLTVITWE